MSNEAWIIICATLVFFMQAGFTALECGLVNPKNRGNVALKNAIDFCVSGLLFFIVGFGTMFGNSAGGIFGTSYFFVVPQGKFAFFLFQLVFCSTAVTIASGALSERMRFHSYTLLVMVLSIAIYPIVGHWIWATGTDGASAGWLARFGFLDFAGSTVVHSVGAWAALAGVLILGPRTGRFDRQHKQKFEQFNVPLVALGVFILWIGWIGFNGGSASSFGDVASKAIVNTVLAGLTGGLSVLVYEILFKERANIIYILNGILAALVSVTASCAWIQPIHSLVIGAVGASIALFGMRLLETKKIDDVVSAIPIHGFCGVWGTLCVAIFGDLEQFSVATRFEQFGIQAFGAIVTFAWAFGISYVAIKVINNISPLRVTREEEELGLDNVEHGLTIQMPTINQVDSSEIAQSAVHSLPPQTPKVEQQNEKQRESFEKKIRKTQILFERTIVTASCAAILVAVGLVTISYRAVHQSTLLSTESTLKTHARIIKDFRGLYTEKVVNRLNSEVKVTHDYMDHEFSIPLPATLTKEIGKKSKSISTQLYSDLPFPWRRKEILDLLKDPARLKTLKRLKRNPTQPIIEEVVHQGERFLRYSIADTMQAASCVDCHNNHPESPKRNWKLGDVRGVLEVQVPYEEQVAAIQAKTKEPLVAVLILLFLAAMVFYLVLRRFKVSSISSQESLRQAEMSQQFLQESEQKLRSIAEASNDAIISTDSKGIIIYSNPAASILTGYSEKELLGNSILTVIPERHKEAYVKLFKKAIELGHLPVRGTIETPILQKANKELITDISLSHWEFQDEIHFTALIRDISRRKEQEKRIEAQNAQLIQSEKLSSIGELAAGVGHEINNPLAITKGYVERLRKQLSNEKSLTEENEKFFGSIEKAIGRIAKIVNGLRTYARSNTEHVEVLDCNEGIKDTTQLVEAIYSKQGVTLIQKLNANNSKIKGNVGQFQQVIMNLISNARDATEGKSSRIITVETKNSSGNQILISVSDNGSGIDPKVLPKIFDTFFTTKTTGKGTGLGLGLSRKFVEGMQGTVSVESELNKGTTFTLQFPTTSEDLTMTEKSDPVKSRNTKKENRVMGRALVVDDEPGIRELLSEYLQETQIEVVEATNGADALQKLSSEDFDFLLTDVQMPIMNGIELLKKVEELKIPNLRTIIITGGVTTKLTVDQGNDLRSLADAYVLKPFTFERIVKSLAPKDNVDDREDNDNPDNEDDKDDRSAA